MTIYLGIDDTDTRESRGGTGRLARTIAAELARSYTVTGGVTRHQLFVHPAVPYTSHNSSAVIHIREEERGTAAAVFATAREMMLADFVEGGATRGGLRRRRPRDQRRPLPLRVRREDEHRDAG
ncbi:hypothetical protein [Methanoculleus chikugoensis]|uniref:hypothetical protein n=1 Tax=Methanoculleus chikugoensis TaxID=118126 RepID=UPI000ABD9B51|nr:hypothetical protein [Methanoculleus chikugoensis]